jgi:hypothetical protein
MTEKPAVPYGWAFSFSPNTFIDFSFNSPFELVHYTVCCAHSLYKKQKRKALLSLRPQFYSMKHFVLISMLVLLQNFIANATDKYEKQPYTTADVKYGVVMNVGYKHSHAEGVAMPLLGINTLTLKPTANGIVLNWTVEETANLQYFLIEYAVDGQSFSPLSELPVQATQFNYSFTDTATKTNEKGVYYRVKAIYPTKVLESAVRKLVL